MTLSLENDFEFDRRCKNATVVRWGQRDRLKRLRDAVGLLLMPAARRDTTDLCDSEIDSHWQKASAKVVIRGVRNPLRSIRRFPPATDPDRRSASA
jgi:hypothetical protein